MASNNPKEIFDLKKKKKLELLWFKDRDNKIGKIEELTVANKNKTKILINLKREYSKEFLEKLINEGFINFQIDGSRLNSKIYNKIVSHLIEYSKSKLNEIPSIIFDLKSPMPLITKISGDRNLLKIVKGQTIKIAYESKKLIDGDAIYIDKKIYHGVNVGDILTINYPELRVKIVSIENTINSSSSTNSLRKKVITAFQSTSIIKNRSSPFLLHPNLCDNHESYKEAYKLIQNEVENYPNEDNNFNLNNKQEGLKNKYYPIGDNIIEEDEEYYIDPNNFDNFFEDMLKRKHEKLEQNYHKIIRKHSALDTEVIQIENKILKEMDKISAISNIDLSGMKYFINFFLLASVSARSISISPDHKSKLNKLPLQQSMYKNKNENKVITCEALEEGVIAPYKTINIQGKDIIQQCDLPIISAKDINDLNQINLHGINIISTIIEKPEDIDEIKEILEEEARKNLKIFAKIDTKTAIVNFDSIVDKADGLIIQNLFGSTNLNYNEIRHVVMYIIEKCKLKNKPIILKINSLKSNNKNRPAITKMSSLDFSVKEGFDSILIYEESKNFKESEYLDSIRAFRQMLLEIEAYEDNLKKFEEISKFFAIHKISNKEDDTVSYLLECSAKLSHEIKADLIILYTDRYQIVKKISQFRPFGIVALPVSNENEVSFLRLLRGVVPYCNQEEDFGFTNRSNSIKNLVKTFKSKKFIKENLEKIIVVNAYFNKNYKYKNSIFVLNSNQYNN